MLNEARQEALGTLIGGVNSNALRSARNRRALARRIAVELELWEPPVQSFVEEMRGLNFYIAEDRLLFLQFAQLGL